MKREEAFGRFVKEQINSESFDDLTPEEEREILKEEL